MGIKFSLIYPTQNRPQFIEMALKFLENQKYENFEVIICDNYTDKSYSCEDIVKRSKIKNVTYIRPPTCIGMVENWNYALNFAHGDYIGYFTDKMFLLPDTLRIVDQVFCDFLPDIVNWVDDKYSPLEFPNYFDKGRYIKTQSGVKNDYLYAKFQTNHELRLKTEADKSRNEQNSSEYCRGKICFGVYKKSLVDKIIKKTGKLFHNISPDYTSMILGLSLAESAVEINKAGIVHILTDLSNGGKNEYNDELSLNFLKSIESDTDSTDFLIPGLYTSTHNSVSHDYISLHKRFNLGIKLNEVNWITYITEDLYSKSRNWSSRDVEQSQKSLLNNYFNNLDEVIKEKVATLVENRKLKKELEEKKLKKDYEFFVNGFFIKTLRFLLPKKVINLGRKFINRDVFMELDSLEVILKNK